MERYQDNLKGKLIEFQGKILYVLNQIEYNGDYYIYVINARKYEKEELVEINILKKDGNENLELVNDMILFDKVLGICGMDVLKQEIKKIG